MTIPRTILVPTDFSENADYALDYATALAGKLGASVHLLNAITPAMTGTQFGFGFDASVYDAILAGNRHALETRIAARATLASFGAPLLEIGDARELVLLTAQRLAADLIVMGTHGRRGFSRVVIGSVAEAVARVAPCPVLLIRQP